jgi:hypothetical protein
MTPKRGAVNGTITGKLLICDRERIPDQAITTGERKQKSVVRGRHENINGKLKVYVIRNLVVFFTSKKHALIFI